MKGLKRRAVGIALGLALSVSPAAAQETKLASLKADAKGKPSDAFVAFALGRAYRRAGKFAEAKVELARAAGLSKGDNAVRARYELVVTEWESGKTNPSLPQPPSLGLCKQVKVGKDGEALSRVCAAEAWLTFERTGMAEDELTAAAKVDGKLYELELARAKLALGKGSSEDAIAKLESLTKATPTRAEAWGMLGHLLLEEGKAEKSVAPLRKARELDADWPEPVLDLARALPDGVEARDLARQAVAMRSTWAPAWLRLGQLELATGGYDAAQKALETAIKQQPKVVAAHVGLGFAFVKLKKWNEAKKSATDAIAIAANHPGARLVMGEAHAGLGEIDEAVDAFKFANGLDTKDPTGLVRAAEVLLAAKESMKAEAHAEAAAKAFPEDARIWVLKGDCEVANKEKLQARESYKKALSLKGPPAGPGSSIDRDAVQKKLDALK